MHGLHAWSEGSCGGDHCQVSEEELMQAIHLAQAQVSLLVEVQKDLVRGTKGRQDRPLQLLGPTEEIEALVRVSGGCCLLMNWMVFGS